MIKVFVLAAAIAAVPVVMPAPATAYDPCVRATNEWRQAVAERDAYCEANRVNRYLCYTPGSRGVRLYNNMIAARERMERACR
ncbi:MAG: hypothetical protein EON96_05170 [Caulobacteraceae bacterium]|nr:MAG: hypothetical protein EON96_05170 [Caulobacteraceae bacterium]